MFGKLLGPEGRPSLLAAGIVLLALACAALWLPLPRRMAVGLATGLALCGVGAIAAWVRRRRGDRYDLNRLFDAPQPDPEEPFEDEVPPGEASAPYCGWCDEAYAPGTRQCFRCGRSL